MSKKIYAYESPLYPGCIKIGETRKDNVESRIWEQFQGHPKTLSSPFSILLVKEVPDTITDKKVHRILENQGVYRVDPHKEWFQVDIGTVESAIESVVCESLDSGSNEFNDTKEGSSISIDELINTWLSQPILDFYAPRWTFLDFEDAWGCHYDLWNHIGSITHLPMATVLYYINHCKEDDLHSLNSESISNTRFKNVFMSKIEDFNLTKMEEETTGISVDNFYFELVDLLIRPLGNHLNCDNFIIEILNYQLGGCIKNIPINQIISKINSIHKKSTKFFIDNKEHFIKDANLHRKVLLEELWPSEAREAKIDTSLQPCWA